MWPAKGHSLHGGKPRHWREITVFLVVSVSCLSFVLASASNRTLGRSVTDFPSSANVLTTNFASLKNTTFKIGASKKYYMKYASSSTTTTTSQGPTSTTSGTTSTSTTVRTTVKPAQTTTVKVPTTSLAPPPPPTPLVSPSPAPSPRPMYGEKIQSVVLNSTISTAQELPQAESLVRSRPRDQIAQGSDVMNVMVAPPHSGVNQQRRHDFNGHEQNYEKFGVQDSLLYQHEVGGSSGFRENQQSPPQFGNGGAHHETQQFLREKVQGPGGNGFTTGRMHNTPPQPISGGGYQFPQNGIHVINPFNHGGPEGIQGPSSTPSFHDNSFNAPKNKHNHDAGHASLGYHRQSSPPQHKEFDAVSAINPATNPWQPSAPIHPGPVYPGHGRPTLRSDRLDKDTHHRHHQAPISPFGPMKNFGPALESPPSFSGSFSAGRSPQHYASSPPPEEYTHFAAPPPPGPPRHYNQGPPKIQSPLQNIDQSGYDPSSAALSGVDGGHSRIQGDDGRSNEPHLNLGAPPLNENNVQPVPGQKTGNGFSLSSLEQGFGDFTGFKGSNIPGSESSQQNSAQDESDTFGNYLGGANGQSHRAPKALRDPHPTQPPSHTNFDRDQSNGAELPDVYQNSQGLSRFESHPNHETQHANHNYHPSNDEGQFKNSFQAGNLQSDFHSFGSKFNEPGSSDSQSTEGERSNSGLETETVTPQYSVGLSDESSTSGRPEGTPSSEDSSGNSENSQPQISSPPEINYEVPHGDRLSHPNSPHQGHGHPTAFVNGQVIHQNFETSTPSFKNFQSHSNPEHSHGSGDEYLPQNHISQRDHPSQFGGISPEKESHQFPASHNAPEGPPTDFGPFYVNPYNGGDHSPPQQSHGYDSFQNHPQLHHHSPGHQHHELHHHSHGQQHHEPHRHSPGHQHHEPHHHSHGQQHHELHHHSHGQQNHEPHHHSRDQQHHEPHHHSPGQQHHEPHHYSTGHHYNEPNHHHHFDSRHHYKTGSAPPQHHHNPVNPGHGAPESNDLQPEAPQHTTFHGFNSEQQGFPPGRGVDYTPPQYDHQHQIQPNIPTENKGFGQVSQENDPGHPGFQDFGNFPSKHAHLVINPNGDGPQSHASPRPNHGQVSHQESYQPPQVVEVEAPPEVVTFSGPPQPGFQETETSASHEHPRFEQHPGFAAGPQGFPGFDGSSPFQGPHHHPGSNQLDELVKQHPGLGPDDSSLQNVPGAGFVGEAPSGNFGNGPSFGPPGGNGPSFGPPGGNGPSFGPPSENEPSFGPPGGNGPSFGPPGENGPSFGPPGGNGPSFGPPQGLDASFGKGVIGSNAGSQGPSSSQSQGGGKLNHHHHHHLAAPIGHHHGHHSKVKKFPVYKRPTLALPNLRSVALSPLKFLTSLSSSPLSNPLKLLSSGGGPQPIKPFSNPISFPAGFNKPLGPVKGLPPAITAPIKALNPVKNVVGGLKQLVATPVKVVKVVKEINHPVTPFNRPSFGIGNGGGPLRGLGGILQGIINANRKGIQSFLSTTPSLENALKLANKLGHKILSFYAKHSIPQDHYLRVISFAGIYLFFAWIFKDSEHILYPKCESWGWNPPMEYTFHAPARFVPATPVDPHLQQEFLNLFRGLENCRDEKVAIKEKKKKKKEKKRKKEKKKKREQNRKKKGQENGSSSEEDDEEEPEDDEDDSVEDDYGNEIGFINEMCPRDNFFYGMSPRHIESWSALARLFVQQKGPADVLHLAKRLLYEHRVNPKVWYLGLQAAARQRPDMTGFSLAHPLDAMPDMFLPGHLIENEFARYSLRSLRVKRSAVKVNRTLSPSKAVKVVRRTSHGIKLRTNVTTTTVAPTSTTQLILENGFSKRILSVNGSESDGKAGKSMIKRQGGGDDDDTNEDDEIDEDDDSEDGEHRNRRKKHPLGYGHGFVGDGYGKYKQKQSIGGGSGGGGGVQGFLGGLLNGIGGGGQGGGGLLGGNGLGGLLGGNNKGEDGEDNGLLGGNNGQNGQNGQGGVGGGNGGLFGGNRDKKKDKKKGKKKKKEKKKCIVVDGSVGLDNGIENKLWYWREDLMVNQHHWYWHQDYPLNSSMHGDRRAELFFFMHRSLLARYNAERLSNGFSRTQELGLFPGAIIDEPYNPHLKDFNSGAWWAARGPHTPMTDIRHMKDPDFQRDVIINDVVGLYNSFVRAIQLGFLINRDGRFLPIRFHDGINPLANTVDASNISVNPFYYDAFGLHNLGHVILALSADPDYSKHLPSGVMGETATSMRDPVFYTYHTVLDNLFDKFKQTLPPYKPYGGVWPLQWHGVDVIDVKLVPHNGGGTNSLTTFYIKHKFQLEPGVDRSIEKGIEKAEVCAVHLDHAPFQFQIVIDKKKCAKSNSGQGTVRIFMAPRYDEEGHRLPLVEQRRLMFQLDAFQVELKLGRNLITRNSRDNALTKPWSRSLSDYERGSNLGGGADYCGCGWPHHLFIPKGNTHGMPFDLFVMVTNFDEDFVQDSPVDMGSPERCNSPYIFCGLPRRMYPDGRPMGYPFDRPPHHVPAQPCGKQNGVDLKDLLCKLTGRIFTRPVATLEEYVSLATNMAMTTFEIKHIPKVVGKHYG